MHDEALGVISTALLAPIRLPMHKNAPRFILTDLSLFGRGFWLRFLRGSYCPEIPIRDLLYYSSYIILVSGLKTGTPCTLKTGTPCGLKTGTLADLVFFLPVTI